MKKEDLNQKRVCDSGSGHYKAAGHVTNIHSILNNSQNPSSSLRKELFHFNTRNCSLFNTIHLPYIGKGMPVSLSESPEGNSCAAAPWKNSFNLHFSSGKDILYRVSHCINSTSVMCRMEEACSFAGDFSLRCPGDNSVCFAHFWLGNLWYNQNLQFLELERSISKEQELQSAGLKELELCGLPDLCSVPGAVNDEYCVGRPSNQKPCFFLCYLNLVSSEQPPGYKKMLSNIEYVTSNFHIIQLAISLLAFALAGFWYVVVRVKEYQDFNN